MFPLKSIHGINQDISLYILIIDIYDENNSINNKEIFEIYYS